MSPGTLHAAMADSYCPAGCAGSAEFRVARVVDDQDMGCGRIETRVGHRGGERVARQLVGRRERARPQIPVGVPVEQVRQVGPVPDADFPSARSVRAVPAGPGSFRRSVAARRSTGWGRNRGREHRPNSSSMNLHSTATRLGAALEQDVDAGTPWLAERADLVLEGEGGAPRIREERRPPALGEDAFEQV